MFCHLVYVPNLKLRFTRKGDQKIGGTVLKFPYLTAITTYFEQLIFFFFLI